MTATIELLLYGDEQAPPAESIGKLAHAVSAWPRFDRSWKNFCARQKTVMNQVAVEDSPMSSDLLEERAWAWDGADRMLEAGCSVPFWAHGGGPLAEPGQFYLEIIAWGPQFGAQRYRDPNSTGYAKILIHRSSPFYAALGPEATHPDVPAINARVQENIDALVQLVNIVQERVSPASVKVFDDNGLRLPFNARFACYRDPSAIADDLRYLSRVWEEGWASYPDDGAMKSLDPHEHAIYFHLSRSEAERVQLRGRLAALLPGASQLSDESVRDVLADRSMPIPMPASSGQLDMMYHFIDESLLAILSAAVTAKYLGHRATIGPTPGGHWEMTCSIAGRRKVRVSSARRAIHRGEAGPGSPYRRCLMSSTTSAGAPSSVSTHKALALVISVPSRNVTVALAKVSRPRSTQMSRSHRSRWSRDGSQKLPRS
jgi:hypothetical protein